MHDRDEIVAIVLAAGASRRFGSNKLLHPVTLNGVTLPLAAHSLAAWLDAFPRITIVVRPHSEEFRAAITATLNATNRAALRWLVCNDASKGMAASLAHGVRANSQAAGWVIGLADMPAVPAVAIDGVRNALYGGAALSATSWKGRRGHPVGFADRYYEELIALEGDAGARELLKRERLNIVHVEANTNGVIVDVDRPADVHFIEHSFVDWG